MAGRSPLRVVVDAGVVLCVIACAVIAYAASRDAAPPIPPFVCEGSGGAPDYARLHAHVHVTAVLGEIEDGGDGDPAQVTRYALAHALGDDVTIVGPLPRRDRDGIQRALAAALADPATDIVYYNGHEYDGTLDLHPPADGYKVAVLDTCWSTQRYAGHFVTAPDRVDVVSNTKRAVTGSVDSFLVFVANFRRRADWSALLAPMNDAAVGRARLRAAFSKYRTPEHYRHDSACR